MFPLARVPFGVPIFDTQPHFCLGCVHSAFDLEEINRDTDSAAKKDLKGAPEARSSIFERSN